jgi:protein-S-isoprenylcysteine O-methyltransferase Ste14
MIHVELPEPLLWALRWLLFLGPVGALLLLLRGRDLQDRQLVGALFAFLYGLALIFATHQLALAAGWWRYGSHALMVMGMPADIWIGGAILFGPVLTLAFPRMRPLLLLLPIVIGLHGTLFSSLKPLVSAGPGWFAGILFVFAVAHLPAIYLARWTAVDRHLPLRAGLLAVGYGFLAFFVIPSLIMHALGGSWSLEGRPLWLVLPCLAVLAVCFLMGLSAVQMFVLHGHGTPVPLDGIKRLVRTGLFAYLTNPMQLSTAAAWIAMGLALGNPWVASAAVMAWIFVAGMVRWHHRHDLLVRFPEGWPTYRANVPEWRPRWRPWMQGAATLQFNPDDGLQRWFVTWLQARDPISLHLVPTSSGQLSYREPEEERRFAGPSATGKALNHVNLFWAMVGAAILLIALPLRYLVAAPRS